MPFQYQGYTLNQPGVIAVQQSNGMAQAPSSARQVVLLGISQGGGQPLTLQSLGGKQDAINKLRGGDLMTSALRAFQPNGTTSPNVSYMRVNPAVQATANVLAGATPVIDLLAVDYGAYTNRIGYQVQTGTTQGFKASVQLDNSTYSQDNLYQAVLSVAYAGASASGIVTVSNTDGNMVGSVGALGSEAVQWTAPFGTYTTIQQLANFINAQTGWSATILTSSPTGPTANALDDVSGVQCKTTSATVTANLQAVINWFNTTPIVTATRPANVGAQPTSMAAMSYLTGGSDGTTTATNWANALQALQTVSGVHIIVPATGDASIHAQVNSHCNYMSQPQVRKSRIAILGGVAGESVSQAISRAQNLNSRRATLVYPGVQDIDDVTGVMTTYSPFHVAAQAAGTLSALSVTTALTHKSVNAKALEGNLQSTLQQSDYDNLTLNGVMAVKPFNRTTGSGFEYVRSLTTWQQDQKLDNLEMSMVCTEDAVQQQVGDALAALVGNTGGPVGPGQAVSEVDSTLRDCQKQGLIVGDSGMPAYGNIAAQENGTQVTVTYSATIPAPMNYFGVTGTFTAYSSQPTSA